MKKLLSIGLISIFLSSCADDVSDLNQLPPTPTEELQKIPGLKDCTYHEFDRPRYDTLYIIRCDKAAVSTSWFNPEDNTLQTTVSINSRD